MIPCTVYANRIAREFDPLSPLPPVPSHFRSQSTRFASSLESPIRSRTHTICEGSIPSSSDTSPARRAPPSGSLAERVSTSTPPRRAAALHSQAPKPKLVPILGAVGKMRSRRLAGVEKVVPQVVHRASEYNSAHFSQRVRFIFIRRVFVFLRFAIGWEGVGDRIF